MSEQLSSEAAKSLAIAGIAILGVLGVNRLRKRVALAWRNRSSEEKPETEPVK